MSVYFGFCKSFKFNGNKIKSFIFVCNLNYLMFSCLLFVFYLVSIHSCHGRELAAIHEIWEVVVEHGQVSCESQVRAVLRGQKWGPHSMEQWGGCLRQGHLGWGWNRGWAERAWQTGCRGVVGGLVVAVGWGRRVCPLGAIVVAGEAVALTTGLPLSLEVWPGLGQVEGSILGAVFTWASLFSRCAQPHGCVYRGAGGRFPSWGGGRVVVRRGGAGMRVWRQAVRRCGVGRGRQPLGVQGQPCGVGHGRHPGRTRHVGRHWNTHRGTHMKYTLIHTVGVTYTSRWQSFVCFTIMNILFGSFFILWFGRQALNQSSFIMFSFITGKQNPTMKSLAGKKLYITGIFLPLINLGEIMRQF